MEAHDLFGNLIHTYTRADAIADGVLLDATAAAKEVGILYPVALTQGAWDLAVALSPASIRACNDERGRLHDVVWMLRFAIKNRANTTLNGSGHSLLFRLHVVATRVRPSPITLQAIVGPGDDLDPVITIQIPNES